MGEALIVMDGASLQPSAVSHRENLFGATSGELIPARKHKGASLMRRAPMGGLYLTTVGRGPRSPKPGRPEARARRRCTLPDPYTTSPRSRTFQNPSWGECSRPGKR